MHVQVKMEPLRCLDSGNYAGIKASKLFYPFGGRYQSLKLLKAEDKQNHHYNKKQNNGFQGDSTGAKEHLVLCLGRLEF